MANLNDMAAKITVAEGKKISLPIGQVKEVMRLTFRELAQLHEDEVLGLLNRYGGKY